eukprot:scaffold2487_cov161-Prasinococcus_capsulatus_cf.AAC.2
MQIIALTAGVEWLLCAASLATQLSRESSLAVLAATRTGHPLLPMGGSSSGQPAFVAAHGTVTRTAVSVPLGAKHQAIQVRCRDLRVCQTSRYCCSHMTCSEAL